MEDKIKKLLKINHTDQTVYTEDNAFCNYESICGGIVYKKDNKWNVKYFDKTNKLYNFISTIDNSLLQFYLNYFEWSIFLPYIARQEFGMPLYFIDKEAIEFFNLRKYSNYYLVKKPLQKSENLKIKKGCNNLGWEFTNRKIESFDFLTKRQKLKFKQELGTDSKTYLATEGLKYSFGIELETCSGLVPLSDYFINKVNIRSVRDGSVRGSEYVTGVLKGDAGFNQLYNISNLLNKQNKVDKSCGMHVHIGGANFNKSFSVYAHILSEKIENSMFSIVSKTRRHNSYCGDVIPLELESIIKKYGISYGVEVAYETLFKAMTYGRLPSISYNRKRDNHHYGRYCGKYNGIEDKDNFRYKWVNLIPCNFNVRNYVHPAHGYDNEANTIEFRFHSGTLNYVKIKNFTLICMAFVSYVENNKTDILNKEVITLEDIIESTYRKNVKPLLSYVDMRQKLFNNDPELLESSDKQKIFKTKKERICV
jgi:hypothetical protein